MYIKQPTDSDQTSEKNELEDSWAAEISGRICLINQPLQAFFKDCVPCHRKSGGLRPWTDPAEVFAEVPSSGQETERYPELVSASHPLDSFYAHTIIQLNGFRKLVSNFDDVHRPKFTDGSKCAVTFPFKDWQEEHHYTIPDILMSFPGEHDGGDTWAKTWHRIAMVFEATNADDPINESAPWPSVKQGMEATGVLIQLSKSARNLMLTHGMLFVFIVGIYKNSARIYRFDRAACVISKSFNIKMTPWPLHKLLWRICHHEVPVGGLPTGRLVPRLLGEDPTFSRASEQDKDAADEKCRENGQQPLSEDERRACRWVTVIKYDSKGKIICSTRFLIYHICYLDPRLFSRATLVSDGYEEATWKRVVVKDAWRQQVRDREDSFYNKIRDAMYYWSWRDMLDDYKFLHRQTEERQLPQFPFGPYKLGAEGPSVFPAELEELLVEAELDPVVGELFGIARLKYGDDLGAREADMAPQQKGDEHSPRLPHYHCTISGGRAQGRKSVSQAGYNERSHMRLVFETVGRPLSQFKSTKELIKGLRDAIHGTLCFPINNCRTQYTRT